MTSMDITSIHGDYNHSSDHSIRLVDIFKILNIYSTRPKIEII